MQFTNPIFLWALTGLSIPIGIHLLSRKEGKVIRLGSLRHVHETSTQQFRGIRLNEIWLLVLRCLLIVLFTAIICGLHWNNVGKKKWLLVEQGLDKESHLLPILDSLIEEGYEARFLKQGFSLLRDADTISSPVNYWGLIEELTSKNLSDVVVFSQNRVDNFKGSRLRVPANVRWISMPLPPLNYTLEAVQLGGDSLTVREGHTNAEATSFTTKKVSKSSVTTNIKPLDTIHITIVSDEKYSYDQMIIKAALKALSKSFPIELKLKEIRSTDSVLRSEWMIWLSDKNIPKMDSKLLYIKPQFTNQQVLFLSVKSNHWVITQRLNEGVALQEDLTLRLASLLIQHEELELNAKLKDRRMVSDSTVWAPRKADNKTIEANMASESANPILIVLLMVLLFIERVVAYKRNQ